MDTKIEDLFYNDIKREINGVIKVDQDDEENVYTELNEYVVTKESLKHIDTFFDRFLKSVTTPTDKIGTWISGDFGSGKSHFLKTLSYLLENKTVRGKSAPEFFEDKISDPEILNTIDKAVNSGTKDVILFNIDSKSGETSERIVDIMMRVFNEKRGYFGDVFWIAELEEDLDKKGLFGNFKEEILKINGNCWEEIRKSYAFEQDDIIEALTNCGFQSREACGRMFESDGQNYRITPESFAKDIERYCKSKGRDHKIIFLIDEIGQYIGDDSQLMLNLQSVAEEFGTILKGRAWIIVTSQVNIEATIKRVKDNDKKQDFSKIQARFDTRLSLSSANVDEVIKKRILKKKAGDEEMLSLYYEEKKIILKNLISFSQGSAEMKNYRQAEDFISVYPFVPYQFSVLQKVFEKIRTTGFTGKHLAKGERSMLNAYKESAEKYGNNSVGTLIPFYSFYDTIESFLDPIIIKTVRQADENDNLEEFDCRIIKTLFMIRHVKELQPNLDNIVVLSLTDIDEDKLELREKVAQSLNRLERETLISKSGDTFHFLTNEEQEISREIKDVHIEERKITNEIFEEIFSSGNICPKAIGDYKFSRTVDDIVKNISGADLTVKFLTPLSDEISRGSGQHTLDGSNLSNVDSKDTLLFVFPEESRFISHIESYLQIQKYLKQSSSTRDDEQIQDILFAKRREAERLKELSLTGISDGVKESRIFIDGREVTTIESKNPKEMIKEGYEKLVENVYSKSDYVTRNFDSDNEILSLLRSDDLERYGAGRSDTNKLALEEVLNYIAVKYEKKNSVLLSELKEYFMKKPYGWSGMTVSGLLAVLFMSEDIKLRHQKRYLTSDAAEITKYLARKEYSDKVILEIRQKTGAETVSNVKSVLMDLFDKAVVSDKENDLFESAKEIFDEQRGLLSQIMGKYSVEERYPGRKAIEDYNNLLSSLSGVSDPQTFLRKVSDEMDEIEELHSRAGPVIRFFEGKQSEIFGRILGKYENYRRNEQFLDEDARRSLSETERILSLDEPYPEIKRLSGLEARIESSLAESVENLKEEFREELESYKIKLNGEFTYEDYPDCGSNPVNDAFSYSQNKVEGSDDCSLIKLETGRLAELYKKAFRETEEKRKSLKSVQEDFTYESEKRDVEIINKTSVFRTEKIIETEDDLEDYLSAVRSKLKEILKKNSIQVI